MAVSIFMLGFWIWDGTLTGAGFGVSSASIVGWSDREGMLRDTGVEDSKWWRLRERVGWKGIGYRTWMLKGKMIVCFV